MKLKNHMLLNLCAFYLTSLYYTTLKEKKRTDTEFGKELMLELIKYKFKNEKFNGVILRLYLNNTANFLRV